MSCGGPGCRFEHVCSNCIESMSLASFDVVYECACAWKGDYVLHTRGGDRCARGAIVEVFDVFRSEYSGAFLCSEMM